MRRRRAAADPDHAEAGRLAAELAWWRGRCEVPEPLDVDELARYRVLIDSPVDVAVDVVIARAFGSAEVQRSVSAANYADARRLGPADTRATAHR